MNFYTPIFADAINLPLVLLFGIGVLIPLLAFQVVVEGAILARFWRIPFRGLARCVFVANCWSLVAGLPVKIVNVWLYSRLLPADLAGYFARYPDAVLLGTLIYFLVTCLVETGYVMKWLAREEHSVSRSRIWSGGTDRQPGHLRGSRASSLSGHAPDPRHSGIHNRHCLGQPAPHADSLR